MNAFEQSVSYKHKYRLSFSPNMEFINGRPSYQYARPIFRFETPHFYSEFLSGSFEGISCYLPENEESFNDTKHKLFSDLYEKPILELKGKIYNIYREHQHENWDGYGAIPIKHLSQSLQFADALFHESMMLAESVDIAPENDGCLCFEWFKSESKFIGISVKKDKLIYNYKIGDEEACGETTFSGRQMLIEQIKKIV